MNAYINLFLIAFIAATLLPAGSEIYLASLLNDAELSLWLLWLVATLGNTLGAIVNYILGRYLLHFQDRKWFPFKAEKLHKSQTWFERYGKWSLLFSWLPLFGDALTFIAGVMKLSFAWFVSLVFIGKAFRYAFIVGIFQLFVF